MLILLALLVGLGILGAVVSHPQKKLAKHLSSTPVTKATPDAPPAHKPRPARPKVAVELVGYSEDKVAADRSIDYGVVLANRSRTRDAVNLTVTVRAVDRLGRSIASDETPITLIPAGRTFNLAGGFSPNVSLTVARLRVRVTGQTQAKGVPLPSTSNVRLRVDSLSLEATVSGRVTNPYRQSIPDSATIYAIFLDRQGHIVGSTYDTTGARVRPGATVAFNVQGFVNDPSTKPVSARVSIDPCGYGACNLSSSP